MSEGSTASFKPRVLVDYVDGYLPNESDANITFIIHGRRWIWEPTGCVLCATKSGLTFHNPDDYSEVFCLRCGALELVKFTMIKAFTLTIGDIVRTGTETISDEFCVPMTLVGKEREELIQNILDDAEEEETTNEY